MASILLSGDLTEGHDGYPPVGIPHTQTYVKYRGRPLLLLGDGGVVHCRKSCHEVRISTASPRVKIKGVPVARAGDLCSCGDKMANPGYLFSIP